MYHHSLPTSPCGYSWKFVQKPVCPLKIPGLKVRTFKAYTNPCFSAPVKIAFFVNNYYNPNGNNYYNPNGKGQDKIMQEIIYPNSITGKWEPVPTKLVKMVVEANLGDFLSDCTVKFNIEEIDGRALMAIDIYDYMKNITGYRVLPVLGAMPNTPAGLIAEYCGLAMATMAQYPDQLRTFADVEDAWNAFARFKALNPADSINYLKSQITWLRCQMHNESKEQENYMKMEQEISENAADAMNKLSERFGIEIAL